MSLEFACLIACNELMGRLKRQAGLNKFEFSVAVVVLTLLWVAALNRFLDLQEMGEKTAVEMTVSNILSGLRFEMADRIMTAREASIVEMADSNPVRWLEKQPDRYLGEFPETPANFQPGNWYFDTSDRELRYWPNFQRYLACEQCQRIRGDAILSWRIEKAGNPMFGRGDRVRVVSVADYRWF